MVSPAMLRLALGYELQAKIHGRLSRTAQQQLSQHGGPNPDPGGSVRLTAGTIRENGEMQWSGRTWRSLSGVAQAITGTRWLDPAFSGLKQRSSAA